ncbi:MAG: hypothetical protein AMXMBFR64_50120 [Myxococcales bacterium]
MSKPNTTKILRIGVIQNGRILEERLLRKHDAVSIGQATKNTFSIPASRLPRTFELLDIRGGAYHLNFDDTMGGRVSVKDKVIDLRTLREKQLAQKRGSVWTVPLTENSRGKITLGDVTLLFQFVAPPPTMARPQLPAIAKGSWVNRIDTALLGIMALSFIIQGGFIGGLHFWWEKYGKYEEPTKRRESKLFETLKTEVEIKKEEKEAEAKKDEEEKDGEPTEVAEEKVEEKVVEAPPIEKPKEKKEEKKVEVQAAQVGAKQPLKKGTEAYAKAVERVKSTTILKFVGSAGPGSGDYANTLADGATAKKLDEAWEISGGVKIAEKGESGTFRGGPKASAEASGNTYKTISSNEIAGPKAGTVKTAAKESTDEVKVKVKVGGSLGQAIGTGKIDKNAVAKVFRRRQGAIRTCYERALKVNPNVEGKISIQFTIGPAGRITSIDVTSNSTSDASIGKCIVEKVRGWRFDPPDNGSVTFSYPFILSRGR